jgi:ABC-type Zn uptake system ZnuABC Zn-binding protein ZnuA
VRRNLPFILFFLLTTVLVLTACSEQSSDVVNVPSSVGDKLKVVATTTIIGDVVSQVGGDFIDLSVLLPVGTDPHSFDPTPQDIALIADADVVIANGAGLEEFLVLLIESAGAQNRVVYLSEQIGLIDFSNEEEEHAHGNGDHQTWDPHTWTNPNHVIVWVETIADHLGQLDPTNAETYSANAATYTADLTELDAWIRQQVAQVPESNRQIVTDHLLFGYFAAEYGFEQVGAIIPGYSTLAEPSAQDLAAMEDAINSLGVQAIFVGNTVNPTLAQRVAEDTGTLLIFVYTGSLSEPDGEAATYIDYVRYNINAFVDALQ